MLRVLVLAMLLCAISATRAVAMNSQEAWFEDDVNLYVNPAGTLGQLRFLGVDRVRLAVRWYLIAPKPLSHRRPRKFNAANPAAYPPGVWNALDQIVIDAKADGIALSFDLVGGAPLWATGPNPPPDHGNVHLNWNPSPKEFGSFARAVATRYSGNYDSVTQKLDPGNPGDVPKVSFWSVWNEPNYGPGVAPQGVPGHLNIENSPRMYRNLVAAEWNALHATGHAHDTFVWGELAPRGAPSWGIFSGMKPLIFLRALYCVDANYRELRGEAATIRGCPANAAGSRQFRARNPGLFKATGVAVHPYMRWYRPDREKLPDPDYTSLGEIGNLMRTLDRLQRVYGSQKRYPVYDTEFGYITTPPKHDSKEFPWVSQNTAAYYLNWAEYISWRNPRIRSFSQYLLYDPIPAKSNNDWGGYASGLLTFGKHARKPTYAAWRLPLYLPVTTSGRGRRLEVWGCARPAHFAQADTGDTQIVEIQFRRGSSGPFTTLRTVPVTDPHGYFDLRMNFPSSGTVRVAWDYPASDGLLGSFDPMKPRTAYSRSVAITLR
ncbi:MAG TPA: hypothetical protein VH279_03840 [Solirubrobacteraceae bacterium]|nr:hypothetical protein [Solirubrobacteraceae bacterium]